MYPLIFTVSGFGIALVGSTTGDTLMGVIGISLLLLSLWMLARQHV